MKTLFILLSFFYLIPTSVAVVDRSGIQFDSNVDPTLKQQVQEDLALVKSISGVNASPLHQEIFGNVDGNAYEPWFYARVFYFGVSDCGNPVSAVACVNSRDHNKIWVTDNYIKISHPEIARVMTLFHEARHTETASRGWPHARCPLNFPYSSIWTGGSLKGHFACDSSEYGSYASASVMLNNISKFCSNCSAKVKADAKLYSDDQIKRVTQKSALARMKQDFLF